MKKKFVSLLLALAMCLSLLAATAWAVEQGVTSGTSAATFSPSSICTCGQIVTFLHSALA